MGDKKISPPPLHWEPEEMYVCNISSEVCGDGEREREIYTHMLENEGHLRGGWDVYSICFLFNFPAYIT